jgi:multidrug resistance protein
MEQSNQSSENVNIQSPHKNEKKQEISFSESSGQSTEKNGNEEAAIGLDEQSPKPPMHTVFTKRERIFIVTMTALGAFFSPLSGQIYFPAIPTLAKDYRTSISRINLTITTYMILQGFAPTIMGSFGDSTGRRPAYILSFAIYLAANIGLATQKSYAALLVLRMLQSAGSSGTVALCYGVIADVGTAAERGQYLGPVASGIMLAPALGPTIGGLLAEYLGWRSIFWFLTIVSGSYLVVYVIFMPETARKIVGDGSIPPQNWWNASPIQYWKAKRKAKEAAKSGTSGDKPLGPRPKFSLPNPLKSLVILREKDALIIVGFTSLGMLAFVALLASIPPLFQEIYHFNALQIGFCYM